MRRRPGADHREIPGWSRAGAGVRWREGSHSPAEVAAGQATVIAGVAAPALVRTGLCGRIPGGAARIAAPPVRPRQPAPCTSCNGREDADVLLGLLAGFELLSRQDELLGRLCGFGLASLVASTRCCGWAAWAWVV